MVVRLFEVWYISGGILRGQIKAGIGTSAKRNQKMLTKWVNTLIKMKKEGLKWEV